MVIGTKKTHKKGKVAPGKVNRNWRILVGVDVNLQAYAKQKGYDSVPAFVNSHFVRFFNGEILQMEP